MGNKILQKNTSSPSKNSAETEDQPSSSSSESPSLETSKDESIPKESTQIEKKRSQKRRQGEPSRFHSYNIPYFKMANHFPHRLPSRNKIAVYNTYNLCVRTYLLEPSLIPCA